MLDFEMHFEGARLLEAGVNGCLMDEAISMWYSTI